MSVADELAKTRDYLKNAYAKVEEKGGTLPTQQNMANLAGAIGTVSGGGGSSYNPTYDIPYFDGGEYGAIAYILPGQTEIKYYQAPASDSLHVNGLGETSATAVATLEDGTVIRKNNVLAYSIGPKDSNATSGNFLRYFKSLQNLYGLENYRGSSFNSYFLSDCPSFNQELVIPETVELIGSYFLRNCVSFNSRVIMPARIIRISTYFLAGCSAFNQPLDLTRVSSIGEFFLNVCSAFNQPIVLSDSITNLGNSFLRGATAFNKPLTIPESIGSIGTYFLQDAASFKGPLVLPSGLVSIGEYFLRDCSSFDASFTIPDTVTSIGGSFMRSCSSFTELNVGKSSGFSTSDGTLSSGSNTALMYTEGVTLTGENAQAWKDAFPDTDNPSYYRKLIVA